jgi:hypothetical protein
MKRYPGGKMIYTDKNYVLYCPKGHGTFPITNFVEGVPKCPTCGENLLKMEGVVQK